MFAEILAEAIKETIIAMREPEALKPGNLGGKFIERLRVNGYNHELN